MGSGKGVAVLRGGEASLKTPSDALTVPNYPTPTGLANVGNTCYANAALQCLLNTALTEVLLEPKTVHVFRRYSSNHNILSRGSGSVDSEDNEEVIAARLARREERRRARDDRRRLQETCSWLTQELTSITREYTKESSTVESSSYFPLFTSTTTSKVVDPGSITKNPHRLSTCLAPYQQEDAHEFLRALLGTLVMNGHNRQLSSLFDGLLESAVTCQHCDRPSLTRDRYMDLSLDISHDSVKTLPDALQEFTRTEVLDGDNKVMCDKCGVKREVTKGLRLATAPSILVCHLKRFAIDPYGQLRRLNKHVRFPLQLEIGDYMSRVNKATPPPYELVGVLVHQGRTCDSGHYLSYVKSGQDWFKCNDSVVTKATVETVLSQQAYILVYEVKDMRNKHKVSKLKPRPSSPTSTTSWDPAAASSEDEHVTTSTGETTTTPSLMSLLCNAATQAMSDALGSSEFCCGPTGGVAIYDDDLEPPKSERRSRRRRRSRRKFHNRSASSSNLKELEAKATNKIPSKLPSRSRALSYGHRSDPGAAKERKTRGHSQGRAERASRRYG